MGPKLPQAGNVTRKHVLAISSWEFKDFGRLSRLLLSVQNSPHLENQTWS